MKIPEGEEERPLSWLAILESTPVVANDGAEVGVVREVLGSQDEDIFHGIVIGHGALGSDVLVPAEKVESITNRKVTVDLDEEAIRALPPYEEHASYQLGFVGLLRKRLGWVREDEQPR